MLSGKGGVGKSTVAANVAMALAIAGRKVGLLDVDIHGPSIPKLLGLEGHAIAVEGDAIRPAQLGPNLKVMSIGFLLASPRDAVVWRGPLKYGVIRQFLADVIWGELDALVIDSPPGTGDEPLSVAQLLGPGTEAVVVTTPQAVAVADVRRSVVFCRQLHLDVIGIVENMAGFACPHCGAQIDPFGRGGGEELATEMGVPFLGRIPFDPRVVNSGDTGAPVVQLDPKSEVGRAIDAIVAPILARLDAVGTKPPQTPGTCPVGDTPGTP